MSQTTTTTPPTPAVSFSNLFSKEGFGATLSGAGILTATMAIEGIIQSVGMPHTGLELIGLIGSCLIAFAKSLTK